MSIFPLNNKQNYVYRALTPVAVSQVLNSLESLTNRTIYQNDNYLRGNLLHKAERYTNNKRLLKICKFIDSPDAVSACSIVNLFGCSLILLGSNKRGLQVLGSILILGNNKLLSIRNAYGRDGADQMGSLILSYRIATSLIEDSNKSNDLFMRAVNFQTCLSYFVPGVAKVASNKWLRGSALEEILMTQAYGTSPVAVWLKRHPSLMRYLTWSTIIWETSFPIIYIIPEKYVTVSLKAIKGFHLGVAITMGLPRFFWGFMGAHSAVEYMVRKKING